LRVPVAYMGASQCVSDTWTVAPGQMEVKAMQVLDLTDQGTVEPFVCRPARARTPAAGARIYPPKKRTPQPVEYRTPGQLLSEP